MINGPIVKYNIHGLPLAEIKVNSIKCAIQLNGNKRYILLLEMKNILQIINIENMDSVVEPFKLTMLAYSKIKSIKMNRNEYLILLLAGLYLVVVVLDFTKRIFYIRY